MVDKATFEHLFWWCYERFNALATPEVGVPGYFRFITLLGECLGQQRTGGGVEQAGWSGQCLHQPHVGPMCLGCTCWVGRG